MEREVEWYGYFLEQSTRTGSDFSSNRNLYQLVEKLHPSRTTSKQISSASLNGKFCR